MGDWCRLVMGISKTALCAVFEFVHLKKPHSGSLSMTFEGGIFALFTAEDTTCVSMYIEFIHPFLKNGETHRNKPF